MISIDDTSELPGSPSFVLTRERIDHIVQYFIEPIRSKCSIFLCDASAFSRNKYIYTAPPADIASR